MIKNTKLCFYKGIYDFFFDFFRFPIFMRSHDMVHPASGNNISSITHSNIAAPMDNL